MENKPRKHKKTMENKDNLKFVPLKNLTAYEQNSRTHSDQQINQIVNSIKEFGFTNPVLIDSNGGIIAGHGRVKAAEHIGMDVVPCFILDHLTEAQRRAYVIADNKIAENAGWNLEMLRMEIKELGDDDFDLNLLGFEDMEIKDILNFIPTNIGLTDENEIPEAPQKPITKPGDIWRLGKHRIICGSCIDKKTVSLLLQDGGAPHLMVTDPPYGVEYRASWRKKAGLGNGSQGEVLNDDRADWAEAWALFPGDVAYVWHASRFTSIVADSLTRCGFDIRNLIVWAKNSLVISRGHYHHQHEPCWYAVREGKTASWNGGRKKSTLWRHIDDVLRPDEDVFVRRAEADLLYAVSGDESTVWEIPKMRKNDTGHSTQKPVECMRRPIKNNSKPGDTIYDPFCGSGTTIIAAEQTGRICYAAELKPEYVDISVKRWEKFTGLNAEIAGNFS